jgi:hypothetical protein
LRFPEGTGDNLTSPGFAGDADRRSGYQNALIPVNVAPGFAAANRLPMGQRPDALKPSSYFW